MPKLDHIGKSTSGKVCRSNVSNLVHYTEFVTAVDCVVEILLPYISPAESGIEASIAFIFFFIFVHYNLTTNWKQWKDDIENLRQTMLQIKTGLENVCK